MTMRVGHGRKARQVPGYLPLLLRLAADTGRRIGAILGLRWVDWRPDLGTYGMLRWRAQEDKIGREWRAPVTPVVRDALEAERVARGVEEADTLLFPAPNDAAQPISRPVVDRWLQEAEQAAELPKLPGGRWHPFRRMWATERKHHPAKDVAAVGGWVDTTTLERCYQAADEATMEAVVTQPRPIRGRS